MRNSRYELQPGAKLDEISGLVKVACIAYYQGGLLHREDGPAVEWSNGVKEWWQYGELHREDGPAIDAPNGDKLWSYCGQTHRLDGPAIEWDTGAKEWYLLGHKMTEMQFNAFKEWHETRRK